MADTPQPHLQRTKPKPLIKSHTQQSVSVKTMYRSESEKIIAGVCGGLAEFFNIDPVIPRIFFIILTVLDGIGVLIYLILWVVIPTKSKQQVVSSQAVKQNLQEITTKARSLIDEVDVPHLQKDNRSWWGIIIIAIGIMLLLNNFDFFGSWGFGKLWPIIIILFGFTILRKR